MNAFSNYLRDEGWNILFEDYHDRNRGGSGSQGQVNSCFEWLFDQFPDIVAERGKVLLIVEGDLGFKDVYAKKLKRFRQNGSKLVACLKESLGTKASEIETAMVLARSPKRTPEVKDLAIWLYDVSTGNFSLKS